MKKIVLFDANNLAMRCIHSKDVITYNNNKEVETVDYDYFKYLMFNSIYMSLFSIRNTGTLILALDNQHSWRYDFWSRYKEDRKKKKKKDKSKFPWNEYFEHFNQFFNTIKKHFPVMVIQVDKCEGDDIIGCIVLNKPNQCEIISTDKDFLQLYDPNRVKIYNPYKKSHVSHPNTDIFLVEQCLCGQSKDSIFNIKTPLNYPEGKRKPGFGPKAFEKAMEYGVKQWLVDNDLIERYKFNKVLMDFKHIPTNIQRNILDVFNNYEYPDPNMIWKYIKKMGYPEVMDNFTNIENKFMELY